MNTDSERVKRELQASDDQDIYGNWWKLHTRFNHVFTCPNTHYYETLFDRMVREAVQGKRVLEIGCSNGWYSRRILDFGAGYVRGMDISPKFLGDAQRQAIPGRLEYVEASVAHPIMEPYDVILGRAVLHHVDYREVLPRLYRDNLKPNGYFFFWEPLGSNLLIRLYHTLVPGVHTPDERSFARHDLNWMQREFPGCQMYLINYLSFPLGLLSSFFFRKADNPLLRGADRIDRYLASHARWLHAHFRNAMFVIRKD